jgi:hypothetical protein
MHAVIDARFVFVGAAFSVVGALSYARDTIRGVTQPNRVSWLMWTIAPMLAFVAELRQGVGLQSVMTFAVGLAPLIILCSSFWNPRSVWKLESFDVACGIISGLGVVGWMVSSNNIVALVCFMVADCVAGLPTIHKSWIVPESESVGIYVAGVLNALITLATVKVWTTAEVAFPIQIALLTGLQVLLVRGRLGPRLRHIERRSQTPRS